MLLDLTNLIQAKINCGHTIVA